MAEWLRTGLQIREDRFDSGTRLQSPYPFVIAKENRALFTRKLSRMDHTDAKDTDHMRHLNRPRGDGKGYVFRMLTPVALKGQTNPRTGKPFGKEIKLGLGTRHLPTARQRRDVILGQLRALELGQQGQGRFSLQSALAWREDIASARAADPSGLQAEGMEHVMTGLLEAEAKGGKALKPLQSFARVAQGIDA